MSQGNPHVPSSSCWQFSKSHSVGQVGALSSRIICGCTGAIGTKTTDIQDWNDRQWVLTQGAVHKQETQSSMRLKTCIFYELSASHTPRIATLLDPPLHATVHQDLEIHFQKWGPILPLGGCADHVLQHRCISPAVEVVEKQPVIARGHSYKSHVVHTGGPEENRHLVAAGLRGDNSLSSNSMKKTSVNWDSDPESAETSSKNICAVGGTQLKKLCRSIRALLNTDAGRGITVEDGSGSS